MPAIAGGKEEKMIDFTYVKKEVDKEFRNRGISSEVKEICIVKNNVPCTGLQIITNQQLSPIIYYDNNEKLNAYIMRVVEAAESPIPTLNLNCLLDASYIKQNVFLTVQRICNNENDVISKLFANLQVIPRVMVNELTYGEDAIASAKVTESLLLQAGISEVDLFEWALNNVQEHVYIKSMEEMLEDMVERNEDINSEDDVKFSLYVASAGIYGGASAILCFDLLDEFCIQRNVKSCIILPSSMEEILLIPEYDDKIDVFYLANLVDEVNRNIVEPVQQLDPVVYRYDRDEKFVKMIIKK